jgi:hypothetical protein
LERNYGWLESMARAWQLLAAEHDPALARFVAPGHAEHVDLEPLRLAPCIADRRFQIADLLQIENLKSTI